MTSPRAPDAAPHLALRSALGDAPGKLWEELLGESFSADQAWTQVSQLAAGLRDLLPSRARAQALLRLIDASAFLGRIFRRRPRLVRWLLVGRNVTEPRARTAFLAQASALARRTAPGDAAGLEQRLRRYKYRELARVAFRDAGLGAPMQEVGAELAGLAEGLTRAALDWWLVELSRLHGAPEPASFCVLGMGKLGGEDLNLSSDIDLIYLHLAEGQTGGGEREPLPTSQFFTKLATALTRTLSAATEDGFLFRVDLNLRPQGRSGALVSSLSSFLQYYETIGRTWERSALIKARCVAGDETLAERALDGLKPFIWRRSLDLQAVDGLREVKAQIDLRSRASAGDVKLGRGGIREVEFFVNALQLLHGGKDPSLRERHTLRALRKLERAGHIQGPLADVLEEAYLFLRRVENRLQLWEERQTQKLPEAPEERARLAHSLGLAGTYGLEAELDRLRGAVHHAFSTLLGQVARDELPDEPLLALAMDPGASDDTRADALARRGFADPTAALGALDRLGSLRDSPFGAGAGGGLKFLSEVASTPDPDQALFHLAEFLGRARAPQGYLALLTRWPAVRRRLLNLFGQSEYLSRSFLRSPELLDLMWDAGFEQARRSEGELRAEVIRRTQQGGDFEERLSLLRRVKNEEVLRIGVADLSDELTVPEVATQLSALADAVLEECLSMAEAELQERYGQPRSGGSPRSLVVLGLGKLGGRELGYHSDLDLIFVYRGEGLAETSGGSRGKVSEHEYFARVTQRLLAFLQMPLREGRLYQIDARLRPSGNQGTLVVSEQAFDRHHRERAQLWERQALIKARIVAGDLQLGDQLREHTWEPLVYERPLPPDAAHEIRRLRTRMEQELSGESADEYNPKTGRGGLVDVEFAVQFLQLLHGGRHRSVRVQATLAGLEALESAGCLAPADARVLRQGYLFLRRTETRLRVVHGQGIGRLPVTGRSLAKLARRLGYVGAEAGARLLSDYRAHTAQVRRVYDHILRDDPVE